jgi:hypothetical protein
VRVFKSVPVIPTNGAGRNKGVMNVRKTRAGETVVKRMDDVG